VSEEDRTLIPSAQNAELKKVRGDAVPTCGGHLEHAKRLQAQLGAQAAR
jgi:hypothetical protein